MKFQPAGSLEESTAHASADTAKRTEFSGRERSVAEEMLHFLQTNFARYTIFADLGAASSILQGGCCWEGSRMTRCSEWYG